MCESLKRCIEIIIWLLCYLFEKQVTERDMERETRNFIQIYVIAEAQALRPLFAAYVSTAAEISIGDGAMGKELVPVLENLKLFCH